ncbi:hypothetical protein COPR103792_04525 [Corynebacterium propinquum]|uniref:hypothetical protein n=1 Tax=Corynebacterium propinquum TaxID=43769 RepID=UPI0012DF83E3|nr:hypothetical protein [Corynebacterium propinquum]MDK4292816.1 hypothetical protein [Corynebacterium propinquum]QQU89894.1 hypothetical protein I6I69_06010 [Corynebacterium propinquum]
MNSPAASPFRSLYPDVNPTNGLPLNGVERVSLVVACMVLIYGCVNGELIIAGVGLALTLFAVVVQSQKTARRIRAEAKNRFPAEDWSEYRTASRLNLHLYIPLIWLVIIAMAMAGFWWIPHDYSVIGGVVIAAISGVLIWFMPGANPVWNRRLQDSPAQVAAVSPHTPA